ncbi:MAG: hypothetical protein ACLGPM_01510 [Acidobacteriota bacterium]
MAAGAVSATHTYNAMRPLDHRGPESWASPSPTIAFMQNLICDGIHVAPETVRLWWKAKGAQRGILVTDAMSATGMPDGEYQLGGFPVQVANGRATARGVLAGSVLTQDRALSNFLQFTGAPLEQAIRLLTANPAQMTGTNTQVAVGAPADMVAIDPNGRLIATILEGRLTAAHGL